MPKKLTLKNSLCYTVFINNIYEFLPIIERNNAPFIFTLYPGGGFMLNNSESDRKLKRVFSSGCFKKVIVTQKITEEYLLSKELCPVDKINYIYGGVFPSDHYVEHGCKKKKYKQDKETFDICFVANKYTKRGIDKGYDTFILVAKELSRRAKDIRFHVVGGFTEEDIDIKSIKGKIRFYGQQKLEFFSHFYSKMDIILSPNVPSRLAKGAFDGFPTGCCMEAGLAGVAVFCTDELKMNVRFKNEKDIKIISTDVSLIVSDVLKYYNDTVKLYALSAKGQKSFNEVFGTVNQMGQREKVIRSCLKKAEAPGSWKIM